MADLTRAFVVDGKTPLSDAPKCSVTTCSEPQVDDYVLLTGHATTAPIEYRFCRQHADQMRARGYTDEPSPQFWDVDASGRRPGGSDG